MSTVKNEEPGADPFGLQRFVEAQDGVYERACAELAKCHKSSHWMWFVFPQMRGLGRSGMAWDFGISSIEEARAYLAHPLLGPRLATAAGLVLTCKKRSPRQIFGSPDDIKFCSSMTLFAAASGSGTPDIYATVIEALCEGRMCAATLDLLGLES